MRAALGQDSKTAQPLLTASALAKHYRGMTAVAGLDFAVNAGEVFGLLGKNGAGKSTTLGMLVGQVIPSHGVVRFRGQDIARDRSAYRARTGMVSQSATLDRQLRVEQLLVYHGRYFGLRKRDARAAAARVLRLIDLDDRADRPVAGLSGGEAARLMIARTLLHQPEMVFLDEPASGLDTQSRERLWRILRGLNQQGTTIVLTTHHLDDAAQLCDRVAIMDHGRMLALDTPTKLINAHGGTITLAVSTSPVTDRTWEDVVLAFPGAVLHDSGRAMLLPVKDAQSGMENLTVLAGRFCLEVHEVVVRPPSLETAYTALTTAVPNASRGRVPDGRR